MYKIIRTALFAFNPERVHSFSMNCLRLICKLPFGKYLLTTAFSAKGNNLPVTILGINFANPVGLAAGFDKNARYLEELQALGFGFVEIGTVTPLAQGGNDKPRVFRLPKDRALINRMGFNNDGVKVIKKRLKKWQEKLQAEFNDAIEANYSLNIPPPSADKPKLIIGGNIGKNKLTPNDEAWNDYIICFNSLHDYVDYFVVNVSSPNTPGLRDLQEKESLHKIITQLQIQNLTFRIKKPIFLKISPDLTLEQIDDIIDLAIEIRLDGLVATNSTVAREQLNTKKSRVNKIAAGGLSGLPLKQRSTDIVEYIHQKSKGEIPIIASGGIFTGADAKEKLSAGAALVQVWTGFVYEGPSIVKNICKAISGEDK